MSLQPPKLPTWIFLVTNLALIAAAGFVAYNAHHPLTETTTFSIVACVIAAAIVGLVPIVAHYERRKNELLDQRQRELEALGRTISTSAEQISIAANGFNEITDLAHRNLKHAEQLPHKLQEKIAEFNSLLENAREDEREEMEKELAELRSSESDRLQTATSQIHKAVAELAKLETVAQKQLAARVELGDGLNQAAAKAHAEAARVLHDASASFVRQLTEIQGKLLHEFETKLAERVAGPVVSNVVRDTAVHAAAATPVTTHVNPTPAPGEPHSNGSSVPPTQAAPTASEPAPGEPVTPSKRPKRIRKEETPAVESAVATAPPVIEQSAPSAPDSLPETAPVKVETVTHISASPQPAAAEPPPEVLAAADAVASAPDRAVKKRSAKKNGSDHSDSELSLGLAMDESPATTFDNETTALNSEIVERVLTSDGATRLIATAYIGIGNRLFVRGSGPGLSWDKGVPLQFVSIGKWRWETSDAQGPIEIKLFKNDEVECAALGTLKLDPGYQQEVTAKF